MLIKRFGLAKMTKGDLNTPTLLMINRDIKINKNFFQFLGKKIDRPLLKPPSVKQKEIEIYKNIYLIPNLLTMLKNTKNFVDYTISLRERIGYDKLFYVPGVPPSLFPILTYIGYDIFDDSMEKLENYSFLGSEENGIPNFSKIIIEQIRIALNDGKLRELVENIPNNKSKEILRYLDLKYYHIQEKFYPIWNSTLDAVSLDSLTRPDVRRWLERLKKRYKKPEWAKYLILIPCSARKPYSISKSHRELREHIKSTMHEVILTSPLALVPRELERFYPAQNYDIPVVGHWYEDEKKMISDTLQWYLENFEYEGIVSFLPENMKFLNDILSRFGAEPIWGKDYGSLERITKRLDYYVPKDKIEIENFKTLAHFQFDCCDELLENAKIKGRYYQINIWKNGKRIFGYNPQKGMLTLTQRSAQCLFLNKKYLVEIDNFYPEGDVFTAGVINATEEIREGDEVVVAYKNEIRGWGIAKMSYLDMIQQKKGKAVKLRGKPQH